MREELKRNKRREPCNALKYWKGINDEIQLIGSKSFNKNCRGALSSQTSSAIAERLFSDLGVMERRQRQYMLDCTLEMSETIRVYIQTHLQDNILPQKVTLHPQAAVFKHLLTTIASEVTKQQK